MNCKNCGAKLKTNAKFCHACGQPVESAENNNTTVVSDSNSNQNANYQNMYYQNMNNTPQEKEEGLAIASVVLGGLSFLIGGVVVILPIVGLILGICAKKKSTLKTVGIILNSVSLFFIVILWSLMIWVFGIVGSEVANSFDSLEDTVLEDRSFEEEIDRQRDNTRKYFHYDDDMIENEDTIITE